MAKLSNSRYLEGSSRKTDPILFSDNIQNPREGVLNDHWRLSALNSAVALQGGGGEFRRILTPSSK